MTRNELIKYIEDELSLACALSINLPPKNINRVIDQSLRWFYENYQYAVEETFYIIPQYIFQTPEFRKHRAFYLCKDVVSVYNVTESGSSGFGGFGNVDKDFNGNKLIASEVYLSPMTGEGLVYYTAYAAFADLAQAFTLKTYAYDFNKNTKKVYIKGRDPHTNVGIQAYIKIPENNLFDDDLFISYVTAQCKIQLSRMLGFFQYNLIGGVQINFGDLKSEGEEEVTRVREFIDSSSPPDWIMVMH